MSLLDQVEEVLTKYPRIRLSPQKEGAYRLSGRLIFNGELEGYPNLLTEYNIDVLIPKEYPKALPEVTEIENKIPYKDRFHRNGDGTLCLGNPYQLILAMGSTMSLLSFFDKCLIPYLYKVELILKGFCSEFVGGELAHGKNGILDDFCELFELKSREDGENVICLLTLKKRIANKYCCPCGCGLRLGKCKLHIKLNLLRKNYPRNAFRSILKSAGIFTSKNMLQKWHS